MTERRPVLSICVGTTSGWPAVEACIRSFLDDATAVGAEVLVADGSGREPPGDQHILDSVRWHQSDEASIFRLVAENLGRAQGEIVALTEDHCATRPGWVQAILRAHEEYPQAAAVGGSIEIGNPDGRLEWASYLMTQGAHMAPLQNGPTTRIANEADISFKRWALDSRADHPLGFLTIHHSRVLADTGALLVNDDRIQVDHFESLGPRSTAIIHFDDGRTISGFRRRAMASGDWLRILAAPFLPIYRTARVVRNTVSKGRAANVLAAIPWILALEYCYGAGEFVGYLRGPGRSPYGLR